MTREQMICVARIGAPHGVRGAVRLWPFTEDPFALEEYGVLSDKSGTRQFEIASLREAKDHLVATFAGVTDRNGAERLNGIELYVPRDALPETEAGEFYHADLIGLAAIDNAGAALGRVVAMHNFGAGDIIEIAPAAGPTLLLPFTDAVVPTVDLAAGHVVVVPPQEIEGDEPTSE
jgi:16S rRNA processing protein RimM